MTVKELKKKLKGLPDHMEVGIHVEEDADGFSIQDVEVADVMSVHFNEGGPVDRRKLHADIDMFVLRPTEY